MITEDELLEFGEEAGFNAIEIALVELELQRFAELVEGRALSRLLSSPEGYVLYTPYRLH
jgi:hypothetical protein